MKVRANRTRIDSFIFSEWCCIFTASCTVALIRAVCGSEPQLPGLLQKKREIGKGRAPRNYRELVRNGDMLIARVTIRRHL